VRAKGLLHKAWGISSSMSRKGNCWDNAPTESFWGHLKVACVLGQRFVTREQAKAAIPDWMAFYNHARLHSMLGVSQPHAVRATLVGGSA
jgi:transposase InsO family protein